MIRHITKSDRIAPGTTGTPPNGIGATPPGKGAGAAGPPPNKDMISTAGEAGA